MQTNPQNSAEGVSLSADQIPETNYVLHRRFDRMGRLIGNDSMAKLMKSHVMVIGLGGVGSWGAESLARSGVGKMTLVDFDEICITNANRQLHALQGLVGQKKATVMGERLKKINPQAKIEILPFFYNEETNPQIFADKPDYVLDAIDNLTAKAHLLKFCRDQKIPVVTSSGAAARLDPLRLKLSDLSETHTDPMAQQLRKILRTKHEFPREGKFDIPCVFSEEIPMEPMDLDYDKGEGFKCVCPQGQNNLHSCDRRNVIYGTAGFVTGAFVLAMTAKIIRDLTNHSAKG